MSSDPHSDNSDGSNVHKGSLNIDELAELRQENLELRDQLIRLKENGANGGNGKQKSEKSVLAAVTPGVQVAPYQAEPELKAEEINP